MKRMFSLGPLGGGISACDIATNGEKEDRQCRRFFSERSLFLPARCDFAHLDGGELRGWTCRGGFERLFARAVEQEKAADNLLRFSERPVDHTALAVAHLDARALRGPGERIAGLQDALCLQALAEAHNPVETLMAFGERPRFALPR